jgi:hypothetical protein
MLDSQGDVTRKYDLVPRQRDYASSGIDARIVSREFRVKPGNPLGTFQLQMISVAPGQHEDLLSHLSRWGS